MNHPVFELSLSTHGVWQLRLDGVLHQGVVVALNDDQGVSWEIFTSDVPRRFLVTAATTDLETAALPERVEGEPAMRADEFPVCRLDRTGFLAHVLREELSKGPLADEADTGTVGFVVDR